MHQILTKNLYNYARENLALVNIYIKEPVVTRILRDQRIPVIWFVANCGGILGLCMGFSIVTVFEVLHCLVKTTFSSLESWYYKVKTQHSLGTTTTTSTIAAKRRSTTIENGENSFKGASAPNLSDENDHHEVVLRMDPEGFDFESKPKLTEASLEIPWIYHWKFG